MDIKIIKAPQGIPTAAITVSIAEEENGQDWTVMRMFYYDAFGVIHAVGRIRLTQDEARSLGERLLKATDQ